MDAIWSVLLRDVPAPKRSVHEAMINIIDEAPSYKIDNIIDNNKKELNKILAKLLSLSINIEETTNSNSD